MSSQIVMAGATGLVGGDTLKFLLDEPGITSVISVSRKEVNVENDKLIQCITNDLSLPDLGWSASYVSRVGIITLGTTLKKAGSKEKLRLVDVELVVKTATAMKQAGIDRLLVVSCHGAKVDSSSFYLRCKGEMEQRLGQLGFSSLVIFRPGPIAGERGESRLDEKVIQVVSKLLRPFFIGGLQNWLPTESTDVAKAIVRLTTEDTKGTVVLRRKEILQGN
jgi:uncharacterized protein YbjT (DUF2867 family)